VEWICDVERPPRRQRLPVVRFPRGRAIYREGDPADHLFIIRTGKVKIGRRTPDGREQLLCIMGPSDMFGAVSMFDAGARTADASAITDVCALSINRIALRSLLTDGPEAAEQLLRALARRLRRSDDALTGLFATDGAGRVAMKLLEFAQQFGIPEGAALRVTLDLTQAEIAQLIGSSRETVNKTLSDFTNRGWIRPDGNSILICEPERLARRAR
jgi:CRP-like cAMP-binding protein